MAYFAIITSMPPTLITNKYNVDFWMGDLSINITDENGLEQNYGIALINHNIIPGDNSGILQGDVCKNPDWRFANDLEVSQAYMKACNKQGVASIIYKKINVPKEGYSGPVSIINDPTYQGKQDTYVIEIGVRLEDIGSPNSTNSKIKIHSTLSCGNDILEVGEVDNFRFSEVPEFGVLAAIMSVFGAGYFFIKKQKRGAKQ